MAHAGDSSSGSCKEFQQDLVLYHYGEPTEMERQRLEAHLEKCMFCRDFCDDLRTLLPATQKSDDPPEAFWESYSREIRQKLALLEQKSSWWNTAVCWFRDWPVPALAAALVFILALTITFSKGLWQTKPRSPEGRAVLEIQRVTEDLDFFKSLDFLDSLDLLEAVDGRKPKPRDA